MIVYIKTLSLKTYHLYRRAKLFFIAFFNIFNFKLTNKEKTREYDLSGSAI